MQSIIFNIAEVDFPENWKGAFPEIEMRLKAADEGIQISGLTALKNIFEAFEFQINEDRAPLNTLIEVFFPTLEVLIQQVSQSNSQN